MFDWESGDKSVCLFKKKMLFTIRHFSCGTNSADGDNLQELKTLVFRPPSFEIQNQFLSNNFNSLSPKIFLKFIEKNP